MSKKSKQKVNKAKNKDLKNQAKAKHKEERAKEKAKAKELKNTVKDKQKKLKKKADAKKAKLKLKKNAKAKKAVKPETVVSKKTETQAAKKPDTKKSANVKDVIVEVTKHKESKVPDKKSANNVEGKQDIATEAKNEPTIKVKLEEGIAFRNRDRKPSDKVVAVNIKKEHLAYEEELKRLQVELMKMQKHVKKTGERVIMIFEGRDASGKGGTIKRIMAHMNARGIRVVALDKPNDQESTQWYFQRYITHLPSGGEIVLFDRSWYNRSMVEPVMGFCTDEQHKRFLKSVPSFEEMLVKDGIKLFKFYFSVSRKMQEKRFKSRETDFLKQYKLSPVDKLAQKYWDKYSIAKFQMLNETNRTLAPWTIIRSDNKKLARINCIKYILTQLEYEDKVANETLKADPKIVISGIDEIHHMEANMMKPKKLRG